MQEYKINKNFLSINMKTLIHIALATITISTIAHASNMHDTINHAIHDPARMMGDHGK